MGAEETEQMDAFALALSLVALTAQDAVLSPGVWVDATIERDGLQVELDWLRERGAGPLAVHRFRLVPEADGAHHFQYGSWDWGLLLILRDEDGAIFAETSNPPGLHPPFATELRAGATYLVDVCTLAKIDVRFELVCRAGAPVSRTREELVEHLEAEGRGDSLSMASAALELAKELLELGRYDRSAVLMERALANREAFFGPDHILVAATLEQLAWPLRRAGRLDEALARLERSAEIWQAHPELGEGALSTVWHEMGRIHKERGELEEALVDYRRALASLESGMFAEAEASALAGYIGSLHNSVAVVLRALGRWGEAREAYEKAVEVSEDATVLANLAALLADQGDLARARETFERALAKLESQGLGRAPDAAMTWNNFGVFLLNQIGDLPEAKDALDRALAIRVETFGPDHPTVGQTLNNMGLVLNATGEHDRARDAFERSLAMSERGSGKNHPATLLQRANLGAALRSTGDLEGARASLLETVEVATRVVGPDHPHTLAARSHLAFTLWDQGDLEGALEALTIIDVAAVRRLGPDHPGVAQAAAHRARLLVELGRPREAWDELLPHLEAVHERMQRELQLMDDGERMTFAARVSFANRVLLSIARVLDDPALHERAYAEVLAWKGRVSRSLMRSRVQLEERIGLLGRRELGRLRVVQGELSGVLSEPPADPEERDERLSALRAERDRRVTALARHTGRGEPEPRPTLERLRAAIPAGAAVVDFLVLPWWEVSGDGDSAARWSEPRVVAWIVRPGAELVQLDLGPAEVLSSAIEELRGALAQSAGRGMGAALDRERDREPALSRRVRELLWDPIAPHVVGADPVVLCPDAFLATLPLGVLRREDGTHLIEHHRFAYLQDAAWLERMSERGERDVAPSLLVVGDVDYGDRGEAPSGSGRRGVALLRGDGSSWSPLPFTAQEIAEVGARYVEVFGPEASRIRLAGADASEERIEAALPGRTVVHLATHGFFDPTGGAGLGEGLLASADPALAPSTSLPPGLLSGIVCAGGSVPSEPGRADGILTAEELSWLDLSSADLVVLSACETGLGRAASGEGLLGLRRTFRMCGARTVIASLWSVADESTAKLMEGFYSFLWRRGWSPLEALRCAQLEVLKLNRETSGESWPGMWAGFVLDGDWR